MSLIEVMPRAVNIDVPNPVMAAATAWTPTSGVAASSLGHVLQRPRGKPPALGQCLPQTLRHQVYWKTSHAPAT